jgi:indole-3-glycerol phosphate synthase
MLLIADLLSQDELNRFYKIATDLGLDVLVEVHGEEDIGKAVNSGAAIIGINNRDLHTFRVDLTVTQKLIRNIPQNKVIVSESGIKTYEDMMFLKSLGVNAVLIGEAFMESDDIAAKMRELLRY